jgi:hypothetical protein
MNSEEGAKLTPPSCIPSVATVFGVDSAIVFLATCGGDSNGGEGLSVEEYFRAQGELHADIQKRFEEGGASPTL